jgi:hypothetical protein
MLLLKTPYLSDIQPLLHADMLELVAARAFVHSGKARTLSTAGYNRCGLTANAKSDWRSPVWKLNSPGHPSPRSRGNGCIHAGANHQLKT